MRTSTKPHRRPPTWCCPGRKADRFMARSPRDRSTRGHSTPLLAQMSVALQRSSQVSIALARHQPCEAVHTATHAENLRAAVPSTRDRAPPSPGHSTGTANPRDDANAGGAGEVVVDVIELQPAAIDVKNQLYTITLYFAAQSRNAKGERRDRSMSWHYSADEPRCWKSRIAR